MPIQSAEFPSTLLDTHAADGMRYKNPYIDRLATHRRLITKMDQVWPLFSGKRSLLELGCGNGHFLSGYLRQHPDLWGLGIDRRFKRLFKTAEKLTDSHGYTFFGDVPNFVAQSPETFWSEVWMQFPDPWPKKKHSKNRMVEHDLYEDIFKILKPGGRFCFVSDHQDYWALLQRAHVDLRLFASIQAYQGDLFPETPESLFKKTMRRHNRPIFSILLQK